MSEKPTALDVIKWAEDYAQWMRENGPPDMRSMIYWLRSVRCRIEAGASREAIEAEDKADS